jgi:hypothetical protein
MEASEHASDIARMSLRPRNPKYVEELTERLRQNLANGAGIDDVIVALADACARRVVDVSPALNAESASQIAVYASASESLKTLAQVLRASERQARREASRRFKTTE